jgi:hypothetical protein
MLHSGTSSSQRLRRVAVALVLAGICTAPTLAQTNLNLRRVINNWPTIELYFTVACDGTPAYPADRALFSVRENGVEKTDLTLWAPAPLQRMSFSVGLVYDASNAMSGDGIAGIRAATTALTDVMDGIGDEAMIVTSGNPPLVRQAMTPSKMKLQTATNTIMASGIPAMYDAIHAGLVETIANGTQPARALIVVKRATTDVGSSRTPQEIIDLAQRNRVRIFAISMGTSTDAMSLEIIAQLTGGRFYQAPTSASIAQIMTEISTIMMQGFQESYITYQATCADGALRNVELKIDGFCSGSDTKRRSYRAERDSMTFTPIIVRTGGTLSTDRTFATYQWFRDGVAVPGATTQTLLLTEPGTYTVEVTDGRGCTFMSPSFDVVTSLAEVDHVSDAWRIDAWPDPVRGDMTVALRGLQHDRVHLRVVDVLGRTVHHMHDLPAGGSVVVPMAGVVPGPYLIIATGAGTVRHHRVVKQ